LSSGLESSYCILCSAAGRRRAGSSNRVASSAMPTLPLPLPCALSRQFKIPRPNGLNRVRDCPPLCNGDDVEESLEAWTRTPERPMNLLGEALIGLLPGFEQLLGRALETDIGGGHVVATHAWIIIRLSKRRLRGPSERSHSALDDRSRLRTDLRSEYNAPRALDGHTLVRLLKPARERRWSPSIRRGRRAGEGAPLNLQGSTTQASNARSGTRFATLGVPQPVASSHPDPAAKPTELPPTALFPTVMSWKARE
jgi:hypothetical protein